MILDSDKPEDVEMMVKRSRDIHLGFAKRAGVFLSEEAAEESARKSFEWQRDFMGGSFLANVSDQTRAEDGS
jgi:hypothetical protein